MQPSAPRSPQIEASELADQTRLGRLLSRLENDPLQARELLGGLSPELRGRHSHRIGITGSPGVGKSTLLARLISHWRSLGRRSGIVAVDPSSPFSGGAIMADRLRWVELAGPDVFVRSLASRGSLGGVSPGAGAVAALIEAAGYDPLLIETIGVGQAGFDVLALADTVVVLFSPESGDGLQMLKAGMLEAGDIIVVNKSDRPGAETMLQEIRNALELLSPADQDSAGPQWQVAVLPVSAIDGSGVDQLTGSLEAHRLWLNGLPAQHPRRRRRVRGELVYTLRALFSLRLEQLFAAQLEELAANVQDGRLSIWDAVEQLRSALLPADRA
ncbi:methylmalonyl Co-A mutase-associated GTPase MeaB [bacterium]|nr:methylmalonyl Co-A mutase-associated GTPase MeaB [bacterium]